MLRLMARKATDIAHQFQQLLYFDVRHIESCRNQSLSGYTGLEPKCHHFRQPIYLIERKAQCFAHIPHRALVMVGRNSCCNRRSVSAIFGEEVLHHLLPPLVLKIDINIRWLVTLFGNKSLEQDLHSPWVNLGNAEAITNGGVGGGTPPLTQNTAISRESHDVIYRQKIRLIAHLCD